MQKGNDMTIIQSTSPAAAVVERMLHEGFAAGNPDIVDELCAPDLIEHQFGLSGVGPHGDREGQARHPDRPCRVLGSALHGRRHRPERRHGLDPRRGHRHAHGPVPRPADRQARALHGDRCGDRSRRPDRRALGRARPLRDPGPDGPARAPRRLTCPPPVGDGTSVGGYGAKRPAFARSPTLAPRQDLSGASAPSPTAAGRGRSARSRRSPAPPRSPRPPAPGRAGTCCSG